MLSTSRSVDARHAVVLASCSSFAQILQLWSFRPVVELTATVPIRFTAKDPDNSRDCTGRCFNTFLGKYQSVTHFPARSNTEYFRITYQPWLTKPKRSATMMCFYDTQTPSKSQNSRGRLVCPCATQLKLWNLIDTSVDTERTVKLQKLCTKTTD